MATVTKTNTKKAQAKVEEDSLLFEDLSAEDQAIYLAAEEYQKEIAKKEIALNAEIVPVVLAFFKKTQKYGAGMQHIIDAATKFSVVEEKGLTIDNITEISDSIFEVIEAITGKSVAKDLLDKMGGDKMGFISIFNQVIRMSSVKKA